MPNIDEQGAPDEGEGQNDGDENEADRRKADSDFDDLIIEVDDSEVASELNRPSPPSKRY
jgi:hypothetical protein